MTKEAQENVQRLQMLEQNAQAAGMQKQQFQAQLFEVEGALSELKTSPTAYKIIGGIMIGVEKEALLKDLQNQKEMLELRVESLEKQEKQLKDKSKQLQEEVLSSVKG